MKVEAMNDNAAGGVSKNIIETIKKTKNTSVKNLRVDIENDEGSSTSIPIKNMCQVWKFCKEYFSKDGGQNLNHFIKVYHNGEIIHDLHAERKLSGKIWMLDKMQIGKHCKKRD